MSTVLQSDSYDEAVIDYDSQSLEALLAQRIRSAGTLGPRPHRTETGAPFAWHAASSQCERPQMVTGADIHLADQRV